MLLLARLFLLAASVVSTVGRIVGLTSHGVRKFHVPEHPDTGMKDATTKCTRERDALAQELDKLLAEKGEVDRQCDADLRYYREMIVMAEQQIDRLKPMVADRLDESDLPPLYEAHYAAIMCKKLFDGFLMDDRSSRLEVGAICDGRQNLTECKLQRYDALPDDAMHAEARGDSAGYYKHAKIRAKLLRLQHRSGEKEPASPECFQAKAVQDQVDSTRQSSKTKEEYCAKEVVRLKANLEKMQEAEDVLWTKYNGHVSQRDTIKKEAALKVTSRFCAVVQASRKKKSGCNSDRKAKATIKAFHAKNCLA